MKKVVLNNKTIIFDDQICREIIRAAVELDELDCRHYIDAYYTKGDFDKGFTTPDIDKIIDEKSEDELRDIIIEMARAEKNGN